MRKVLIIDTEACGLAMALKFAREEWQVFYWLQPKPTNNPIIGDGFKEITKINNWVSYATKVDLILTTGNDPKVLLKLDEFRGAGLPVYAPSVASANLEIKRGDGMKFLESHGIAVPEYMTFKSLREAELYQWKNEERFVFKTLGSEEDKSLSYCGKSPADMVAWLQRKQKEGLTLKGPCMLQKFIPGVEFAVSQWMGSQGFIGKPCENFEFKPLMPGGRGKGPNTGEMGTVMKYVDNSKLATELLKPIEADLVKLDHRGDIDVNVIIDEKGKAWCLEFTARCGWPATNIMLRMHEGDPGQWMIDAINGKDTLKVQSAEDKQVALGVVLATPQFPYVMKPEKQNDGIPIYGVSNKDLDYVALQYVQLGKAPVMRGETGKEHIKEANTFLTAGEYIAVVTGLGTDVVEAKKRAYKTVDGIDISGMLYRIDIGDACRSEIPKLQVHGYCTDIHYGEEE